MISIRAGKNRQVSFKQDQTGQTAGGSLVSCRVLHRIVLLVYTCYHAFQICFLWSKKCPSQLLTECEVSWSLNPFRKPSLLVVMLWLCNLILCHLHSARQEQQRHVTSLLYAAKKKHQLAPSWKTCSNCVESESHIFWDLSCYCEW